MFGTQDLPCCLELRRQVIQSLIVRNAINGRRTASAKRRSMIIGSAALLRKEGLSNFANISVSFRGDTPASKVKCRKGGDTRYPGEWLLLHPSYTSRLHDEVNPSPQYIDMHSSQCVKHGHSPAG